MVKYTCHSSASMRQGRHGSTGHTFGTALSVHCRCASCVQCGQGGGARPRRDARLGAPLLEACRARGLINKGRRDSGARKQVGCRKATLLFRDEHGEQLLSPSLLPTLPLMFHVMACRRDPGIGNSAGGVAIVHSGRLCRGSQRGVVADGSQALLRTSRPNTRPPPHAVTHRASSTW